jgi:hypothetical protein
MRPALAAMLLALASHPRPASAFVPPGVDAACPRAALQGTWVAYAHTLNGGEMAAYDRMKIAPGHLDLTLKYSSPGQKCVGSVLYEVERPPTTCLGRSIRYEVFQMTWDLELVSNDELIFRSVHPERGTHVIRLRRGT